MEFDILFIISLVNLKKKNLDVYNSFKIRNQFWSNLVIKAFFEIKNIHEFNDFKRLDKIRSLYISV